MVAMVFGDGKASKNWKRPSVIRLYSFVNRHSQFMDFDNPQDTVDGRNPAAVDSWFIRLSNYSQCFIAT